MPSSKRLSRLLVAPGRVARKFWADTSGVSATEFAILAPVFFVILAGIVDIGFTLYSKFRMESQVSAVANYTMTSKNIPTSNSEEDYKNFVTPLVCIAVNSENNNDIQSLDKIQINFNDIYNIIWTSGTCDNFSSTFDRRTDDKPPYCYCPTRDASTITWGSRETCGSPCSDGSRAGKYLWYETTNSSPLSLFGRFSPDYLTSNVLVRLPN